MALLTRELYDELKRDYSVDSFEVEHGRDDVQTVTIGTTADKYVRVIGTVSVIDEAVSRLKAGVYGEHVTV